MVSNHGALIGVFEYCQAQGRIQEFSRGGGGAQTVFKKKSDDAWVPTHSQAPCLCKYKGVCAGDTTPLIFPPLLIIQVEI